MNFIEKLNSVEHDTFLFRSHNSNSSTLASLPMIGMDDFTDPAPPPSRLAAPPPPATNGKSLSPLSDHSDNENQVGTMSDR